MKLRPSYWLWRFYIWRTAHVLPEWHRFFQAKIAKNREAHKPTKPVEKEYTRRVHAALRQEIGK
jgi:hypothetical protein